MYKLEENCPEMYKLEKAARKYTSRQSACQEMYK